MIPNEIKTAFTKYCNDMIKMITPEPSADDLLAFLYACAYLTRVNQKHMISHIGKEEAVAWVMSAFDLADRDFKKEMEANVRTN